VLWAARPGSKAIYAKRHEVFTRRQPIAWLTIDREADQVLSTMDAWHEEATLERVER